MILSMILPLALAALPFEAELMFPPEPFHNHGSSIVETPGGDLLSVWFHGTGERQSDDVLLRGARKPAGSAGWSEPFLMADTPGLPDCNPVLFVDGRGVLWLIWITVQDNEWGGSLLKYRTATDFEGDGPPVWNWQDVIHARPKDLETRFQSVIDEGLKTYTALLEAMPGVKEEAGEARERAAVKLHQRLGWMTRTPPIMLDANTMMVGLYSDVFNCSLGAFTKDGGANWSFSTPILDRDITMLGNIQPAYARRKNGEIVAFMRDNGLPRQVRMAVSQDNGESWAPIQLTGIPNPGSSVDVEALQSGAWAMVCNDTLEGRHRLAVYLSEDEGKTWNISRVIEEAEAEAGSFSYPALIQGRDGVLHVSYSYRRDESEGSAIKHARFTEGWIKGENPLP